MVPWHRTVSADSRRGCGQDDVEELKMRTGRPPVLLAAAAVAAACTAAPQTSDDGDAAADQPSPPTALEQVEAAAEQAPPPEALAVEEGIPPQILEPVLRQLVDLVTAGEPADGILEGDRLLLLSADAYAELPVDADGRIDVERSVPVGLGCGGMCELTVKQVFDRLGQDLDGDGPRSAADPAQVAAQQWPALTLDAQDRSWTAGFGPDGVALVSLTVQGLAADAR